MANFKTNFLGDFTARQVDNLLLTITRYTRFVMLTKHMLVILIVLIVGAVIIFPILNKDMGGIRVAFSGITKESETQSPKMLKPQFRGFDANDQPFTVTADYAVQKDEDTIQLINVDADITLKDGKWISIKAKDGMLKVKAKKLSVTGAVTVFYDDGYEFTTEQINVDMNSKTLSSDVSVHGQGVIGILDAAGFDATHANRSIRFKGPVKLVIYPKASL